MNQNELSQDYLKRYVLTSLASHLKSETHNLAKARLADATRSDACSVWRPTSLINDSLQIGETLMSKFAYEGCQLDIAVLLSDYFHKNASSDTFSSDSQLTFLSRLFHLLQLHVTCLAWACSAPAIPAHHVEKLELLESRVMNLVNQLRLNQDLQASTRDWIDKDDFSPCIKSLLDKYSSQGLINTVKRIVQETDAVFIGKVLTHHLQMQGYAQSKAREAERIRECFKNLTNLQADDQLALAQLQARTFRGFEDRSHLPNTHSSTNNQNEPKPPSQIEVVPDKRERLIMELKEKCEKENKTRKNLKIIELKSAKSQLDRIADETKSRDHLSVGQHLKHISMQKRGMLKVSFNTQVSQKRTKQTLNNNQHLPFDKLKQQLGMHSHLFDYHEMDECEDRSPLPPAYLEPQSQSHPPLQQQLTVSPKPKPRRKDSDARSHFIMDFDAWGQDIVAKSTPIRGKASKASTPKKSPILKS